MDAVLDSVKLRWPIYMAYHGMGSPWISPNFHGLQVGLDAKIDEDADEGVKFSCSLCSLKQRTGAEMSQMSQIGSQWTYAPYPNKTFCCPTRQDTSASTGDSMDIEFEKDPQHVPALSIYIYVCIYKIPYPIPSTPKADHRCTISLQVPYFGDHQILGIELREVVRLKQSEATSRGKRKTPEPWVSPEVSLCLKLRR